MIDARLFARMAGGLAALALVACAGPEDTSGSGTNGGPLPDDGTSSGCGDAAPEVARFTVNGDTVDNMGAPLQTGGLFEFGTEDGPQMLPFVRFFITTDDADGALHWRRIEIYWDTEVDGQVATTADSSFIEGLPPDSPDDCERTQDRTNFYAAVAGGAGEIPYSTTTEFAVVVEDADGNLTNDGTPLVTASSVFFTPDAAGQYPDN